MISENIGCVCVCVEHMQCTSSEDHSSRSSDNPLCVAFREVLVRAGDVVVGMLRSASIIVRFTQHVCHRPPISSMVRLKD